MEFLIYTLALVASLFVVLRPQQERLAFRILTASFVIAVGMFVIATSPSYLPVVNL